jgi:hypothetical protein
MPHSVEHLLLLGLDPGELFLKLAKLPAEAPKFGDCGRVLSLAAA